MARILAFLTLVVALPAAAQPSIAGDWSGAIEVAPAQSLTAVLHVVETDSGYVATFDSPDQGAFGLPLSGVAFDGVTFSAMLGAVNASFTGLYVGDGPRIEGTWQQGGRELPLTLTPYEATPSPDMAAASKPSEIKPGDYTGDWAGVMPMDEGGEMRLTFRLSRNDDGTYNGVMDAPGHADNLDLGQIEVYGKEVVIDIMGQASFTGTISEDERSIGGTFEQGGDKNPMILTRR